MEYKAEDIFKAILTQNVNLTKEEYDAMLDGVAGNYEKNAKEKNPNYKKPSLRERRARVQANYYGQSVNMLYQVISMQVDLIEQFNALSFLVETVAEKVGIDLNKTKTAEQTALEAIADSAMASARVKVAEAEKLEKENREQNVLPFKK